MEEESHKKDFFASDYLPSSALGSHEDIFASDYLTGQQSKSRPDEENKPSLLKRISNVLQRSLGVASENDIRFFVLSMNQSEFRQNIYQKNQERLPNLKFATAITSRNESG